MEGWWWAFSRLYRATLCCVNTPRWSSRGEGMRAGLLYPLRLLQPRPPPLSFNHPLPRTTAHPFTWMNIDRHPTWNSPRPPGNQIAPILRHSLSLGTSLSSRFFFVLDFSFHPPSSLRPATPTLPPCHPRSLLLLRTYSPFEQRETITRNAIHRSRSILPWIDNCFLFWFFFFLFATGERCLSFLYFYGWSIE